ncbi:MAG: type I-D CRISPR-associated protein Cas5/Csc1 [Acidobacteriota bacterium]
MKVFKYKIELIDPLFYSKEGLSGAISPKYLHATAINYAVAYSLGINPEAQPYIISEENRGRNTPRYENSLASEAFYFTPGRPIGNIRYISEIAKGEDDNFVKLGYGASTGKAEVLKASQLFSIPPESIFEGFLIVRKEMIFPLIIRLGSFRGKALLNLEEIRVLKEKDKALVAHLVDPLVSKTIRGMMIGMFPYPIIENAVCERCIEIKVDGFSKYIALPDSFDFLENNIKRTPHIAII